MKKPYVLISLSILSLVSCNLTTSLNDTPLPIELLDNPETLGQIRRIEMEQADRFEGRLTDLIKEGHVSTTPNETNPIVIELERSLLSNEIEEEFKSNPNTFYEPTHDRVQVEEYFVDKEFVTDIEVKPEVLEDKPPVIEEKNSDKDLSETDGASSPLASQSFINTKT